MKYLYLSLCLLALTSCGSSKPEAKSYVCFNPFMPIQSIQVDTGSEYGKEVGEHIELTDTDGNKAYFPKSLCVEVRRASESN
jgi:uncharacterized protein YcfL